MDNDKKNTNLGDEILNIAQNAINSNDFTKLNSDIRKTVDAALKEVRELLKYKEPVVPQPKTAQQKQQEEKQSTGGNVHVSFMSSGTVQYKPPVKSNNAAGAQQAAKAVVSVKQPAAASYSDTTNVAQANKHKLVPVPHRPVGKVSGKLLSVAGPVLTGGSAGVFLLELLMSVTSAAETLPFGLLFFAALALPIGAFMWIRGKQLSKRALRLQAYVSVLKLKGFANIPDLARSLGVKERFIIRDLQKMMELGMFPEGRFDDNYTCFIANKKSYEQYRATQDNYYQKMQETGTIIDESKIKNDRVRAVIKEGNDYIAKIRHINDELPDEEISKKLDVLEMTITKIFFQVEQHPEQLSELDKFLKYYMPTTMKLLNVYCDFDKQPIQGENITTAKREILGSLDTINQAFIKLFDSLFQATAWDVSTDITVLQTMLANEGLTDTMNMVKGDV